MFHLKSFKNENKNTHITRKDAIKKMGKYAALTTAGTFLILNPKKAQAASAGPKATNPNRNILGLNQNH